MTEVSCVPAISRNLWNAAKLVEKVQLLTTHYLHSTSAAHLEAAQRQLKRNEVFGTSLDTSCQLHSLTMVDPYQMSVQVMLKHTKPGYASSLSLVLTNNTHSHQSTFTVPSPSQITVIHNLCQVLRLHLPQDGL